ncbi:MAG: esterase family protein [Actinobacteria bacterium]|nr:esterase family protein [Actinomycetota bacterium]
MGGTATGTAAGPRVGVSEARFAYPDPEWALRHLSLVQDLVRPRRGPAFRRNRREGEWVLRFPRHPVDRMEYLFELTHRDGGSELTCDPGNPLRAPGHFGERSVIEFPGYRRPEWVDDEPDSGELELLTVPAPVLGGAYTFPLWTSQGAHAGQPLPLLVAHDGPEYAAYSGLLRFLDAMIALGELPPMRAALLPPPGDRNQRYSASAVYARVLVHRILPAIDRVQPLAEGPHARVCMGASLGGLAALHAQRLYPSAFGALFVQSSSLFRRGLEEYESSFVRFGRIARFVDDMLAGRGAVRGIPVTMTCGTVEENLASNRAAERALRSQGYDVRLHEFRDAHNWIAWRDTFEPHLLELLQRVWR